MNKYLIKLADHLDKKGFHKEADYVDWILKNASNNLNDKMNQYVLKELRKVNAIKAAEYIEEVLKESDKLHLYKKGGFLKKNIYIKFELSYRYIDSGHPPGRRVAAFDIFYDLVYKDGSKDKKLKQMTFTIQDKAAAFHGMYTKIPKPQSAISGGEIHSTSTGDMFEVYY